MDDEEAPRDAGADAGGEELNERVLHTRVPRSLDRQLKERARRLGMSVSTLVRHVLLGTVGLVEDIVSDGADVALSLAGLRPLSTPRQPPSGPEILGWQEAVLAVNAVCGRCNALLPKGTRAAIGVREAPGARAILCRRCLGTVTAGAPAPPRRGGRAR